MLCAARVSTQSGSGSWARMVSEPSQSARTQRRPFTLVMGNFAEVS